jgi:hypothetical protein
MGETPDHIREDIEETRARMGVTVEAIGYKADVKSRVKDSIVDKKDAVVGGADALVSRVSGAVPDREQVKSGARKVGISKQNPLGLAIAGAAAGFVAGTLLPSTDVEDEQLGEVSDQVGEKAREAGQEALDRTKDVAREAVDNAKQTVQDKSGDEAQGMACGRSASSSPRRVAFGPVENFPHDLRLGVGVVLDVLPLLGGELALRPLVELPVHVVRAQPIAEEEHAPDLLAPRREDVQVHGRILSAQHAVLIPVRLAHA